MVRPEIRQLAAPIYFCCGLLLVIPLLDLTTNLWPLRPGDMAWRYGASGLLSGFLLTPLLGLCLASATAGVCGHRRTLRLLGAAAILGAAALLGITILFTLDAIQFRFQVPSEGRTSFQIGAVRAWGKHLTVIAGLAWLGLGAMRAARSSGSGEGR